MAKTGIFERVSRMARANINAILDKAEDPGKMLNQMVRDYTNNIHEATEATAEQVGFIRMQQNKYQEHINTANKSEAEAQKAMEFYVQKLSSNDNEAANRYEQAAQHLLSKAEDQRRLASIIEPNIVNAEEQIDGLKNGVVIMREQLANLGRKREELQARARQAEVQERFARSTKQIDMTDPTSELARFEEAISRREAKSAGALEMGAAKFGTNNTLSLEAMTREDNVKSRLEEMKRKAMLALPGANNETIIIDDEVIDSIPDEGIKITY